MNIAEYHCGHLEVVLLGRELGMNVEVLEEVGRGKRRSLSVLELGYVHHAMAGTLRVLRSVHGEHGHFDLVLRGDGHAAAKALMDEYRPKKKRKGTYEAASKGASKAASKAASKGTSPKASSRGASKASSKATKVAAKVPGKDPWALSGDSDDETDDETDDDETDDDEASFIVQHPSWANAADLHASSNIAVVFDLQGTLGYMEHYGHVAAVSELIGYTSDILEC